MTRNNAPSHKAGESKSQDGALVEAQERLSLLKALKTLQEENKMLQGKITSNSPAAIDELRAKNRELKESLEKVEKELAIELITRKKTLDAVSISDNLQVLKTVVIAYCKEKKIDPSLWKSLESL